MFNKNQISTYCFRSWWICMKQFIIEKLSGEGYHLKDFGHLF